jgi:hypothetical protein
MSKAPEQIFLKRRHKISADMWKSNLINHQGMWVKTTMKYHLTPIGPVTIIKKKTDLKCGWGYGEKGTLVHSHMENNVEVPQNKWDYHVIQQSHFWVYTQKNWNKFSEGDLYPCVHCSRLHNSQGTNKLNSLQQMSRLKKYCLALKKHEILTFAASCMNLEDVMLGETKQAGNDKCTIQLQ